MLITLKAQPLGTGDSMVINRKLIMTPHPKPNHLIDLRKPEGQAEEGVKGGIFRQGNPTMKLAESSPFSVACARAHIACLPTLRGTGVVTLHDGDDIKQK